MRHKRMTTRSVLERVGELGRIAPVAVESAAVHEECRSRRDTASSAGVDVAPNPIAHRAGCQVVSNRDRIDADCGSVFDQIVVLQCILVLVQQSMHRPERILSAALGDGLGRFGGGQRVRMLLSSWKMSEDEPYVITDIFQHLLQDQVRKCTLRVLVITVLDQCDRCVCLPSHVFVGANG